MRWAGLLILAAVAGAEEAGDGASKEPELASKARLSSGRWKFKKVRFNYELPDGKTAAAKPAVKKARVEKLNVLFLDMDGDGRFGEIGVDAWALTGMNYALPFEPKVVVELTRLQWRIDEKSAFVHWAAEPVPVDPTQTKTFRQFNYWRLINGLCPVDFDPETSGHCAEHCAWMEKNGFKHYAAEGDSAMTENGELAGRRSMLSQEKPGMSVLMTYASFYHRLPLMNPATRTIGIGYSRRYTAIDAKTHVEERLWKDPVIVPAPGTALQPTHFPPEKPRPYPAQIKAPGMPITLTFRKASGVTDVRAKLERAVRRGTLEVPVLLSSPESPANKKRPDNRASICIIPRAPLAARGTYRVSVEYKLDGEVKRHQWLFTTGHRRPVWR